MAWTETEISQFQIENNKALAEVNATLRPDKGLVGNVGVYLQGQAGDLMTAMSVLKYRDEIFAGRNIVWFVNSPNCDLLKYAPISEVRPWPWPGNGMPIDGSDYYPLLTTSDNKLNQVLKLDYEDCADILEGWFPAPHQLSPSQRHGIDYPNCSKRIFGVPDVYPWHPVLAWSEEEKEMADCFFEKFGLEKKIYFETFAGSGQSRLNEEMIVDAMNLCREHWDGCSFIFGSHKYLRGNEKFPEHFFDQPNVYSSAEFTVRQSALITSRCDLMISVSSGLTVAASAWNVNQPATVQFCGSEICSTKALSHTNFQLVTADDKPFEQAKKEFYDKLIELLKRYK
jgi:hypothetical protein